MADLNNEIVVLRELERARNAIRHKHKLLKVGRETAERVASETFKPIVQPLVKLANQQQQRRRRREDDDAINDALQRAPKMETKHEMKMEEEEEEESDVEDQKAAEISDDEDDVADTNYLSAEDIPEDDGLMKSIIKFMKEVQNNDKTMDMKLGVRMVRDTPMMGNQEIKFTPNLIIIGDNKKYRPTLGLIELLFKKSPDMKLVSQVDEKNYAKIVLSTMAHRNYYRADGDIRRKDMKYIDFVRPMELAFQQQQEQQQQPEVSKSGGGGGGGKMKIHASAFKIAQTDGGGGGGGGKPDYVYWDDPNELVDRLRLLVAETAAGNNSHHNEIQSIIEELREARIIY